MDVLRIRMQVGSFSGPLDCAKAVVKSEGPKGLYAGLTAGIARQIAYSMPRMGLYTMALKKAESPNFGTKLLLGSACGGVAAVIGVPTEVALVRMAADARAPVAERRNYKNLFDLWGRVVKEEGVGVLWSGTAPTVIRAMLLNAGQLGVYSEAKERIKAATGVAGLVNQGASALISASAAVAMSCPADVMKSRLQNAAPGEYAGIADCFGKLTKTEGIGALWKGSGPAVMKLAPYTVIAFVFLDNLTKVITGKEAM